MAPPNQVRNIRSEGHEDRIQRLEDKHTDIQSELSEQTVKLDHLKEAIETGIESVVTRIEETFCPLSDKVSCIVDKMDKHEAELLALKSEERGRQERWSFVKKVGLGTVVAVGGAFLAQAGEWLWTLFRH